MPDNLSTASYPLVALGQFGERARPLRDELREAALVIGVGQVGLQAVARLHEMLDALLTRREVQSKVRLLAIARRRSIRDEAILPREERLTLNMDPINWGDVPGRYAQVGVARWWPHSPRARELLDDPWQIRAYSRLLLFENAGLAGEALYKLVQWLTDVGTGRDLKIMRRIYVLASLAEAEGSGMMFDIVSRLRALTRGEPATINGVFSLRALDYPGDPDRVLAMANVYAALREIDAYTLHPEMFVSTLPVIGYSLPHARPRRALDTILLADDASTAGDEPPESLLAECVTTWIAASLLPPGQTTPLPAPIPQAEGTDRFSGYSMFGVSKLALPTRAAMDLTAIGLAQAVLKAVKTAHASTSTAAWASQVVASAEDMVRDTDLLHTGSVADRLREWIFDMSAAGLTRRLETRAAKGEISRMVDLVQAEWRRMEREALGASQPDQGTVTTVPDSLRNRMDARLGTTLRELHKTLLASPAELAYARGYGLIWTVSAFEELERQIKAALTGFQRELAEAQAGSLNTRQALMEISQQYDMKSGGRFSGKSKNLAAELDARAQAALTAAAGMIAAQARLDAWQGLRVLVDGLRDQVRDAIPLVEQASQALNEFETACRRAMDEALTQPPRFPAAVALTREWYAEGTQDFTGISQLPPRDLLAQVFDAWGPGDVPPERQLSRILQEIRDAARRALAGTFRFSDLYEFLSQNEKNPAFRQMVAALPGAATPPLVPVADDKHPPPTPYEIVREVSRPFSGLSPSVNGVARGFVPSPDPDEITVTRVLHGFMAEALPALRESYRRAYERAGAEGIPLHVDRRWDSTMADLVHTTARREISTIWEDLLTTLQKNPRSAQGRLEALIRAFGVALDVLETAVVPNLPRDLKLIVYKLRPFRLKLPPPNCAVLFMYATRSADEVAEDVFRVVTPLPMEEQFLFVVNINARPDIDQIVEPLRKVDFNVLVLNEADIKHLVSARMPTRALSDLVLNRVNLTTVSPFYTRGPVPEHMFFGREREINEVRSKLRSHSVALIGGRRIGKTSTLQRIQRLLKPHESEYMPYYLDCHGATNYRSLFWLVNRRWQVDIVQDAHPVQFEDVITDLQARHPGKNVVVLLDEIDSLLVHDRQSDNQETLFRMFRSLSNEKRCQFVFSGEKWLMRAIANPYSALFNFTQAVRLEPLPPKVVHHLVADPFEMLNIWMEQSEQIIERIYQISAGHPNIVQMICQAMIEELDQDPQNANLLNFEHLDRATARRTLQEEIVQTIWGQMSPLARLVTLTWPEGARFLTLTEIEAQLHAIGVGKIPADRLERTAKDLELYCFVRPRDNDRLELLPMAFPAILDFMTDKRRQIEIVRRNYEADPEGGTA